MSDFPTMFNIDPLIWQEARVAFAGSAGNNQVPMTAEEIKKGLMDCTGTPTENFPQKFNWLMYNLTGYLIKAEDRIQELEGGNNAAVVVVDTSLVDQQIVISFSNGTQQAIDLSEVLPDVDTDQVQRLVYDATTGLLRAVNEDSTYSQGVILPTTTNQTGIVATGDTLLSTDPSLASSGNLLTYPIGIEEGVIPPTNTDIRQDPLTGERYFPGASSKLQSNVFPGNDYRGRLFNLHVEIAVKQVLSNLSATDTVNVTFYLELKGWGNNEWFVADEKTIQLTHDSYMQESHNETVDPPFSRNVTFASQTINYIDGVQFYRIRVKNDFPVDPAATVPITQLDFDFVRAQIYTVG